MLVMPELGGLSPNLCKGHVQLMLVMLGLITIKEKKQAQLTLIMLEFARPLSAANHGQNWCS